MSYEIRVHIAQVEIEHRKNIYRSSKITSKVRAKASKVRLIDPAELFLDDMYNYDQGLLLGWYLHCASESRQLHIYNEWLKDRGLFKRDRVHVLDCI